MTLLDTHTFVWLASDQKELSAKAAAAIKRDLDSLFISVVTTWEIALLYKKRRRILHCLQRSLWNGRSDIMV